MGFIGYRKMQHPAGESVRIYLECRDDAVAPQRVSSTYAVNVIFPLGGIPCALEGVKDILSLKKFYKLVFSLEERAREHGNDFHAVFASPESLVQHLDYTRNARLLDEDPAPRVVDAEELSEPECSSGFRQIA